MRQEFYAAFSTEIPSLRRFVNTYPLLTVGIAFLIGMIVGGVLSAWPSQFVILALLGGFSFANALGSWEFQATYREKKHELAQTVFQILRQYGVQINDKELTILYVMGPPKNHYSNTVPTLGHRAQTSIERYAHTFLLCRGLEMLQTIRDFL